MKKLVTLIVLAVLTVSVSFATENGKAKGNQVAIAKAAIKSCPNSNGQLQSSVEVVSACFYQGFITKVTFYKKPNCPGNKPCIQVIETVGTVTLGCDNEVIDVTCGSGSIY